MRCHTASCCPRGVVVYHEALSMLRPGFKSRRGRLTGAIKKSSKRFLFRHILFLHLQEAFVLSRRHFILHLFDEKFSIKNEFLIRKNRAIIVFPRPHSCHDPLKPVLVTLCQPNHSFHISSSSIAAPASHPLIPRPVSESVSGSIMYQPLALVRLLPM